MINEIFKKKEIPALKTILLKFNFDKNWLQLPC